MLPGLKSSAVQQLLHAAAARSDLATLRWLVAAAPEDLTARKNQPPCWCPLHVAAVHGHVALVACMLQAAPQAARIQDLHGRTALHVAVECNRLACVRLLAAAAPAAACIQDTKGHTPLAVAARLGREAAAQCLVELALQAAALASQQQGRAAPLQVALAHRHVRIALLVAGPAGVLRALRAGGIWTRRLYADFVVARLPLSDAEWAWTRRLYADFVVARLPLSDAEWAAIPSPCSGLGAALPAALHHSAGQAGKLLSHVLLSRADKARMHTLALCLARQQRRLATPLPALAVQRVLALCLADS